LDWEAIQRNNRPVLVKKLAFPDPDLVRQLCGEQNVHLQVIKNKIGLSANVRGNEVILEGGTGRSSWLKTP